MSNKITPAIKKCIDAVKICGMQHPHFLLVHTKLRYEERINDPKMKTMAVNGNGTVFINPDFVNSLNGWEEIAAVMCHEMLHLILQHHVRGVMYDPWMFNVAADMCINYALRQDGFKLPASAYYPPQEYIDEGGELYSEAMYEWIKKNPQKLPKKQKPDEQPAPGQGCSVVNEKGEGEGDDPQDGPEGMPKIGSGDSPDWRQVAIDAKALAQSAGRGTSSIVHLLTPKQPKINWKQVLKHGIDLALSKPGRDFQTFAKRHRRSPADGIQFPGWRGMEPKVAVVIDVSGSMNREWVDKIVTECKRLSDQYPTMRMYLVSHTSDVVWEGWVDRNTQGKFTDAVQFSGGTNPDPAYLAVKEAGRFDTLIHFTDCEFFAEWPKNPAKHLVVGAFTRKIHTQPPKNAHVIPCEVEDY